MTQIKRVPFDYEYFKKNPETKLETRKSEKARFIGETYLKNDEDNKLVFETKYSIFGTTIDGLFVVGNEYDVFMLLEFKEVVLYSNIYDKYITHYDTLEYAIKRHSCNAKSVAKNHYC